MSVIRQQFETVGLGVVFAYLTYKATREKLSWPEVLVYIASALGLCLSLL